MSIPVVHGNCPCALKRARELDTPDVSNLTDCPASPDGRCLLADDLTELVQGAAATDTEEADPKHRAVVIDPAGLRGIYGDDFGDVFFFVTSPDVRACVTLRNTAQLHIEELTWDHVDTRGHLIATLRDLDREGKRCSVLWIVSDEFEHYVEEDIGNAKLAAISFFSNPFTPDRLARYLTIVKGTRYIHERLLEKRLIDFLGEARRVIFDAPRFGARASFDHHATEHWFSLHGALEFGQQTVLPTGELAVLADASGEFSFDSSFALDGTLVLTGQPILHRGNREVTPQETDQTFAALAAMQQHAILLHIKDGIVQEITSPTSGYNPLLSVFDAILNRDSRYRKVHEVGFGTNTACSQMTRDNFFANERSPGLHCGFGLGSFTPFHIDLACTEIDVLIEDTGGVVTNLYTELGLSRGRIERSMQA